MDTIPHLDQISQVLQGCALFLGILALGFVCLLRKAGFVGMAVWFHSAHPRISEEMTGAFETRRWKCFILGLINAFGGLLLIIILLKTEVLALIGLLLFVILLTLAVLGFGAVYQSLGLRLAPPSPADTRTKAIVIGGVAAESAFLVPVVGQLFALWVMFRGLGAIAIALRAARRRPAEPAVETPQKSEQE